jgi:hypothetical protein
MQADSDDLRRDLRRLLLLKVLAGEPLGLLVLDGMLREKWAELHATRKQAEATSCRAAKVP